MSTIAVLKIVKITSFRNFRITAAIIRYNNETEMHPCENVLS